MDKSPAALARAKSLDRQVKCLELRKAGLTYRLIGQEVKISAKQAQNLVVKALAELRALKLELAADVIEMEMARQEDLLRMCWIRAKDGSLNHIDRAQVIIQRITALSGVDIKSVSTMGELITRSERMTDAFKAAFQASIRDGILTEAAALQIWTEAKRAIEGGVQEGLTQIPAAAAAASISSASETPPAL